jgi:2-phospho-L-lactate guanylyltransferase
MNLWAIVPLKPLDQAKSRLSGLLSPSQRAQLVLSMLDHTLAVLVNWSVLDGVLVVSADHSICERAQKAGAQTLLEPDTPGLNDSLERARQAVLQRGAQAILVVPGDIPQVSQAALSTLLPQQPVSPFIAIAADRHQQGTNALLLAPADIIPFKFGDASFQKHQNLARKAHADLKIITLDALANDIDCPDDFALLNLELSKLD